MGIFLCIPKKWLIALILGAIAWMSHLIIRRLSADHQPVFGLCLLPAFLMWITMGDYQVMLTSVVAFALAMSMMLFEPRRLSAHLSLLALLIPVGYYIIGIAVAMPAIYHIGRLYHKFNSRIYFCLVALSAVAILSACAIVSSHLVHYPLYQLFIGIAYYAVPGQYSLLYYLSLIVVPVWLMLSPVLSRMLSSQFAGIKSEIASVILLSIGLAGGLQLSFSNPFYDDMEYEMLERAQNWDAIIHKATLHEPDTRMAQLAFNLAMYKSGGSSAQELSAFMLNSHSMVNNQVSTLMSDIFFQMGFTNISQRYAFESLMLTSNYNESGRLYKRLAETNLVNGDYRVSEKYLLILQKSLFYRGWADKTLQLIRNPKLIEQHPIYGPMRKSLSKEDRLLV